MKNKLILLASITILMGASQLLMSQDTILLKKNRYIVCHVVKITDNKVEYQKENIPGSTLFTITKDNVTAISLADGSGEVINESGINNKHGKEILHARTVIKFHPFSMLNSHIAFSYERYMRERLNFEGSLGIISSDLKWGSKSQSWHGKVSGAYVTAGLKFIKAKNYNKNSLKQGHPFKGFFVMPELGASYYKATNFSQSVLDHDSLITDLQLSDMLAGSVALTINIGNQLLLGECMTIGYQAGIGFAFDTHEYTNPEFKDEPTSKFSMANTILNNAFSHRTSVENIMALKFKLTVGFITEKERSRNISPTI